MGADMRLKDTVRAKICGVGRPSASTFRNFVHWAGMFDSLLIKRLLDEIQNDLNAEEIHFREISALLCKELLHHQLRKQWCVYCEELRNYYRSLTSN